MKLDSAFQTMYDTEVHKHFLTSGVLNGKTREKTITGNEKIQFRKKGYGMASLHVPKQNVADMNVQVQPVECPVAQYDAFDYTDEFSPLSVNVNAVKEAAEVAADALARRADQIKIDAIKDGFDSANMSVGGNSPLTLGVMKNAKLKLDKNSIPKRDRFFIYDPVALRDLLNDTEFTSADFVDKKQLSEIEAGVGHLALGFEFLEVAPRPEGGLPVVGTGANAVVSNFAYHKSCVGYAVQKQINTSIDWLPEKRSWLVGGTLSAGAVVIDDRGIVEIKSHHE
jgi:hypothetical protein